MTKYRVLVEGGLDYPTSALTVKRILAGEHSLTPTERRERHAEQGDTVDDIPSVSVPGLLEKGYIEVVG